MKILNIDHLGIAVGRIAERTGLWTDLLGLLLAGSETVPEQKVTTAPAADNAAAVASAIWIGTISSRDP